jgi:molecular chaperone DnaK (HSP70)
VVHLTEDDICVLGSKAKEKLEKFPERTFYSMKRLLGKAPSHFANSSIIKNLTFSAQSEAGNKYLTVSAFKRTFSLIELVAMQFLAMKGIVEKKISGSLTPVVFTVPPCFNDNQRRALLDAAELAGLPVFRLVSEAVATAVYLHAYRPANRRTLILDCGGGACNASVVNFEGELIEMMAAAGSAEVGGDDFDAVLAEMMREKIVSAREFGEGPTSERFRGTDGRFKSIAEAVKIKMQNLEEVTVRVPPSIFLQPLAHDFFIKIRRKEFYERTSQLVHKIREIIGTALTEASTKASELDRVVLLGGTTKLETVGNLLKEMLPGVEIIPLDSKEVISHGAAIYGQRLKENSKKSLVIDVSASAISVGTIGDFTDPIFLPNTPIPTENAKTFETIKDNQENLSLLFYDGRAALASSSVPIGIYNIHRLPAKKKGALSIPVTFEIDVSGLFSAKLGEKETSGLIGEMRKFGHLPHDILKKSELFNFKVSV